MNPVSFTRLRKSCRAMDQIAERHRQHIAIQLRRINIDPARLFYWIFVSADGQLRIEQLRNLEDKIASSDEMLFKIYPIFNPYTNFEIKLSEASRRLSGFTFEKVIVGEDFGKNQSSLSLMSPQVLEEYMKFVRTQCWRTNAILMNHTLMEIWKIFKPKMKSVKTIVTTMPVNGALLDVREIPRWVENLLFVNEGQEYFQCLRYEHYLGLIGSIAKAFYADQLFVPYIQVKRISIRKSTLIELLGLTEMKETEAAETFLLHYLENTPFSGSVMQYFYDKVNRFCFLCKSKTKWIGTSNAILTSRTGRKGLLAVRIELKRCDNKSYEVSIYFWKDQLDFLMPTKKYLEKDSDGINVPRLQTYKEGIIGTYFRQSVFDPTDEEARTQMLMASSFAGMGFGNAGVHICHGLSYPISSQGKKYADPDYPTGKKLIPHGLSVMTTAVADFEFTTPADPKRYAETSRALGADLPVSRAFLQIFLEEIKGCKIAESPSQRFLLSTDFDGLIP